MKKKLILLLILSIPVLPVFSQNIAGVEVGRDEVIRQNLPKIASLKPSPRITARITPTPTPSPKKELEPELNDKGSCFLLQSGECIDLSDLRNDE